MPAPPMGDADTIRILIASDNHVGYGERDPVRKDDSWRSFDEALQIAREREVDMVLLGGDLFHDNKPSRAAMYQVLRSLRANCLGDRPCELELLSDKTDVFEGPFNHANYEDPDINVALPVFSIHGNHDDPTGDAHLASLDLLQVAGLVNYFGRAFESDNLNVRPVLLQKGRTKLALYGISNVRDERLFRTFRDGGVKFFRPSVQPADWFNLGVVHQNRHAYTETGYLPENFLPSFLDFVVWGHEHECRIDPELNPETNFHVMQPGSSVATSLVASEAVSKHVAILNITGRDFTVEPIRLKTVRPFLMKDIVLADDKVARKAAKSNESRGELTRRLTEIVDEMIEQARAEWLLLQEDPTVQSGEEAPEVPLPLIRLRVEYTAPEGGHFDLENPQRFSNRFVGKVANVNDVVQFHRKKQSNQRKANFSGAVDAPDTTALAQITLDSVKVEKLVAEYLSAQSLTILPQNSFGDAVALFVDKDDKFAVETFVKESLNSQVEHLLSLDRDDPDLEQEIEANKARLEELFRAGYQKNRQRTGFGHTMVSDDEDDDEDQDEEEQPPTKRASARGSRSQASKGSRTTATRGGNKQGKGATTKRGARTKTQLESEEEDEDEDVLMPDKAAKDDDDSEELLFIRDSQRSASPPRRGTRTATKGKSSTAAVKKEAAQPKLTQTRLQLKPTPAASQASTRTASRATRAKKQEPVMISDEDVEDSDDEAFEPAPVGKRTRQRG